MRYSISHKGTPNSPEIKHTDPLSLSLQKRRDARPPKRLQGAPSCFILSYKSSLFNLNLNKPSSLHSTNAAGSWFHRFTIRFEKKFWRTEDPEYFGTCNLQLCPRRPYFKEDKLLIKKSWKNLKFLSHNLKILSHNHKKKKK